MQEVNRALTIDYQQFFFNEPSFSQQRNCEISANSTFAAEISTKSCAK